MNNQQEEMDKITLGTALAWQAWKMVWAGEPQRKISVEMTYDDLVRIVDMMKKKEKSNGTQYGFMRS